MINTNSKDKGIGTQFSNKGIVNQATKHTAYPNEYGKGSRYTAGP